jgi:predicted nuclease with TOPRIM domain
MVDDQDGLTQTIARGFERIGEQLREREKEVTELSKNVIRIEGDLKSVNATLSRIDSELSRSENESLKLRVGGLETAQKEFKGKQDSNANWIRGLLVSVILLLLGFLWNLLRDRLK